jgi:glycine cleavage system H protein
LTKKKRRVAHEWLNIINGDEATVGITAFAQEKLGELVYVELPEVGRIANVTDSVGVAESVKAAADILCPVSGAIIAVNEKLVDTPDLVNLSAKDKGGVFRIKILASVVRHRGLTRTNCLKKCWYLLPQSAWVGIQCP